MHAEKPKIIATFEQLINRIVHSWAELGQIETKAMFYSVEVTIMLLIFNAMFLKWAFNFLKDEYTAKWDVYRLSDVIHCALQM